MISSHLVYCQFSCSPFGNVFSESGVNLNKREAALDWIQRSCDSCLNLQKYYFTCTHKCTRACYRSLTLLCLGVSVADRHIFHGDLRAEAGDGSNSQRARHKAPTRVSPLARSFCLLLTLFLSLCPDLSLRLALSHSHSLDFSYIFIGGI